MTSVTRTATAAIGRTRKSRIPPLQWWRGERQPHLDASHISELRRTIGKIHLLAFPQWPAAVLGNAGAAVSIGLYVCSDSSSPAWLVDLVGALLLMCAAEGSEGAALVLRHLRRRHGSKRRTKKAEG
jgi:hypothetical protein